MIPFFSQNKKQKRHVRGISSLNKGFTLIELMVSLTLFVIVIMAAITSLYTVNSAARKVEAMRSVLDNLNFAIESMSRTIRTGTNVSCMSSGSPNCSFTSAYNNPGDGISVESTLGVTGTVEYRWSIVTATGTGIIEKCINGDCVSLTAPGINVQRLSFYVDGADTNDDMQPSVVMLIQGIATAGENTAPFAVQTKVSVRSIE